MNKNIFLCLLSLFVVNQTCSQDLIAIKNDLSERVKVFFAYGSRRSYGWRKNNFYLDPGQTKSIDLIKNGKKLSEFEFQSEVTPSRTEGWSMGYPESMNGLKGLTITTTNGKKHIVVKR